MAEPLVEELALDLAPALENLGSLDEAFTQIASNFSTSLAEALTSASAVPVTIGESTDATAVGTAVETAVVDATAAPAVIEGDATAVDTAITDAVDAAQPPVTVEGDTTGLASAITDETGQPQTVDVGANVAGAAEDIASLSGSTVTIEVDADTSAATDQIDILGQSAQAASGETDSLKKSTEGFGVAAGLATGEVGALGEGASILGGSAVAASAGVAALAGFIGETIKVAADAEAQQKRFNAVFGETAEQVKKIDVGGLTIDLEQLGAQSGTTAADLDATAARIGTLAQSAGLSKEGVVSLTDNLLALGGTIAVNNPRLGDAAAVTDRLSAAFVRGGRALTPFGISLSAAQIAAEALKETGKATAAELSTVDKIVAGTTLTLAKYGDTLGTKFADGAANAQVQLRGLKVQLEETLVAIGQPLLQPVIDSFSTLLPVAQSLGQVLGALAQVVLPIAASLAPALSPLVSILDTLASALGGIATVANAIPGPILGVATAAALIAFNFDALAGAAFTAAGGLDILAASTGVLGTALDIALGPVGLVIAGVGIIASVLGVFDSAVQDTVPDTQALDSALFGTAKSADELSGRLTSLTTNYAAFLSTQLLAGKNADQNQEVISKLHLSYTDLATALTSSDDAFNNFVQGAVTTARAAGVSSDAIKAFSGALGDEHDRLQADSAAKIENLLQTGQITQAQVDQVKSQLGINEALAGSIDSTGNYVAALEGLTQAAQANAAAQQAALLTNQEMAAQVDALTSSLATGAITAEAAAAGFQKLGLSAPAATDLVKNLNDGITKFIDNINSKLPTAAGAVDAFGQQVGTDFSKLASDVASGTGNVKADLKALADDADPARFTANLAQQVTDIVNFQSSIDTLVTEGFGQLAGVIAQQGPELGGALARGLAGDEAKARAAAGVLTFRDAAQANIDQDFREKFPELQKIGVDATGQIATGLNVGIPTVKTAAGGVAEGANTGYSEKLGLGAPTAAGLGQIVTTINGPAGKITISVAGALGTDMHNAAGANSDGAGVGRDFTHGVAQGILDNEAVAGVLHNAADVARRAEAAARAAAGSNSPSLLFAEVGKDLVRGLTLGLTDSAVVGDAMKASAALAGSIADPFANTSLNTPSGSAGGGARLVKQEFSFGDITVQIPNGDPETVRQAAVDFVDQVQQQAAERSLTDLALAGVHAG